MHYFTFEDCIGMAVDYEIIRKQTDVGIMSNYVEFGSLYYVNGKTLILVDSDKFRIDWDKIESDILGV
jgi:hypothetical protein